MTASLLPPNATDFQLAQEAGMVSRDDVATAEIYTLWDPYTVPIAFLPFLAWSLRAPIWDPVWPEWKQREYVAGLIDYHAHKGTRGAVEDMLASIGHPDAEIVEHLHRWSLGEGVVLGDGHTLRGQWTRYIVRLKRAITIYEGRLIRRLLGQVARGNARLVALDFTAASWRLGEDIRLGDGYTLGVV